MPPLLMIASILAAAVTLQAGQSFARPNYTGNWILDKDRSFSNPAGLNQTMTIVHDGEEVQIKAKMTTTAQGDRDIEESWTLDGKEREFTPSGAKPGTKGKRKAHWLPQNRGILLEEETATESPTGIVIQQTTRKLTLSGDGNILTVDYFLDGPRGSFEAKRVFVKR